MRSGGRRRPLVTIGAAALAATVLVLAASGDTAGARTTETGGLRLLARTVETTDEFVLGLQLPGVVDEDDIVVLAVHRPVADRAEFRTSLDGEDLGAPLIRRVTAVSQLSPTIRGSVRLEIDRDTVAATLPDDGVYPVSVELRAADQTTIGRLITHLVRVGTPLPTPVRVALSLVMDVAPEVAPTGNIAEGDPTARWIDTLVARPELPFTVQPTPLLLEQFRSDPRVRRFIARLASAEVVAAPYVPIDARGLELAGLGDRADALFARGVASLTDLLGREPITTRWLSTDEPEPAELRLWYERGVRDVVIALDRVDLAAPVEVVSDTGQLRALVAPSWFSATDPADAVLGAHHVLAELAVMALTEPVDAATVLLFDTEQPFDQTYIDELLDGLAGSGVIDPVSLSTAVSVPQLVDRSGRPAVIAPDGEPSERIAGDLALYLGAVSTLQSYRSMINEEDTSRLHDDLAERLLLALGRGISGPQRDAVARATIAAVQVEIAAVEPPPLGGVSLTSREATAPFAFRNTADYPLRVEVRFLADKARFLDFDDGETTTIVLAPGITTREFRVQALSAGSFPLRIEMFSPDGRLELGAVDLTMRSTVPSGVGVALTVGAVIVLVAWWGRDLLRGRRRAVA